MKGAVLAAVLLLAAQCQAWVVTPGGGTPQRSNLVLPPRLKNRLQASPTPEREAEDGPYSYPSIVKNNPLEIFDPAVSWGLFDQGFYGMESPRVLKQVPIFPLSLVAFPSTMTRLLIFEMRYRRLFTDILQKPGCDGCFGMVFGGTNKEGKQVLGSVGCLVKVRAHRLIGKEDGRFFTWQEGIERFRIKGVSNELPYMTATVELGYKDLPIPESEAAECERLESKIDMVLRSILENVKRYALPEDKADIDRHIGHYLEYSVANRGNLGPELSETERRELFVWRAAGLGRVFLETARDAQLMVQLRDMHARLVLLYDMLLGLYQACSYDTAVSSALANYVANTNLAPEKSTYTYN